MQLSEKAAYVKGLIEGLGLDPKDKQTRVFKTISDLLCEMAEEIKELMQYAENETERSVLRQAAEMLKNNAEK